jgi:hypothetical protein
VSTTSGCSHLAENLITGALRANARSLDELAATSRQIGNDLSGRRRSEVIYSDLLAGLVAARSQTPPRRYPALTHSIDASTQVRGVGRTLMGSGGENL